MTSPSKPFTRSEVEDLFRLHSERLIATVESGFAPDRDALDAWGRGILADRTAVPTESLVDALRLASEFDVVVRMTLEGGEIVIDVDVAPHDNTIQAYRGAFDEDAAFALVAWLHQFDKEVNA